MLERKIKINGIYKHFKGHIYKVIGIAKDSEDLKEKVVYQNIKTKELWLRDEKDFLSLVDKEKYPNIKQTYRFELIKKQK